MKPHIAFTGGGTAGHVIPNIALIKTLQKESWQLSYVGSPNGVEKNMITALDIPYYAVKSGKLRRYFSWQTFLEPINITLGIFQAYFLLRRLRVQLLFSKGGFVSFPVVVAAWMHRIPIILHESDLTPGLANRLSFPFANKIALTFADAKKYFKRKEKLLVTGTPLREELFQGSKEAGLKICGFQNDKPCLLIMGGSQGAKPLNDCLKIALPELLRRFQVVHLCGKGKRDQVPVAQAGYCVFEYVDEALNDLFAAADLVISRAGANALYEILALHKPHILIPLSLKSSRGDQVENARYFEAQGFSEVIKEEELSPAGLLAAIEKLEPQKQSRIEKMKTLDIQSASEKIIGLIKEELYAKS